MKVRESQRQSWNQHALLAYLATACSSVSFWVKCPLRAAQSMDRQLLLRRREGSGRGRATPGLQKERYVEDPVQAGDAVEGSIGKIPFYYSDK